MKQKNKLIVLLLVFVLLLSSCAKNAEGKKGIGSDKKIKIVATTFPQFDWIREIAGENMKNIELTLLLNSGVDLHSYKPTAEDIITISNADLFIHVGGASDAWVDDVLKATSNDVKRLSLVEILDDKVKMSEEVEGMQPHDHEHGDEHKHEDGHEHGDEHKHEDGHEHGDEHKHEDGHKHGDEHKHEDGHKHEEEHEHEGHKHLDEHVWLSLKNAIILVDEIATSLAEIDKENADLYKKNASDYIQKLSNLDLEYEQAVNNGSRKTILFADRFPFRYMIDDYNLEYFAAFSGCSAESEASFETIAFLSEKVKELDLKSVMTLEGREKDVAETVISNSGMDCKILEMDSMQSINQKNVDDGAKYFDIMKENKKALEEALK